MMKDKEQFIQEKMFSMYDLRGTWASEENKKVILEQLNIKLSESLSQTYDLGYTKGRVDEAKTCAGCDKYKEGYIDGLGRASEIIKGN